MCLLVNLPDIQISTVRTMFLSDRVLDIVTIPGATMFSWAQLQAKII